ncbi:MAG TPA: [FeFe] hydrogenase H-cluster maturation GTPase HydF [Spirochaetota bacterium]|nr:[FeFe] hydrogenase H-cluster maturation GTPase HydF [Spirochaetota bacterium]HOS32837.1 [FeFe] hydrogenase H-cluster maturation GTPase HydF [Spirochaetota bacterium]HOS56350.1 [FeFe] hydrogenase H-cluster maturation GTPase HydF [Spirochaetota bacterium]HPK61129.1 [FeFe] hydrogenase H-cluster maturation GTPase HydF [Spirochaetota bacterium]HQF77536.1 [FeFe] hydrogenase H-cluster maturation GTPase HydF [Spirochaetota bacterium]
MSLTSVPLSEQIRIVFFGLRNTGKSSLMNNVFEKDLVIVSDTPGTTTDPVTRSMELGKLGPVAFTDTAGFDDAGELGSERIKKSLERINSSDISILVTRSDTPATKEEIAFIDEIRSKERPLIIASTYSDRPKNAEKTRLFRDLNLVYIDNIKKTGIEELKDKLVSLSSAVIREITPVEGLVDEKDLVILVTPIDSAAPKGRLILPQVETIRDLLDKECAILVLKERELKYFYDKLTIKPRLIITDSQVFTKVAADIPEDQALTSFSILFARKKGDLAYYIEGIKSLNSIKKGAKILVIESCSHRKQEEDIGTVKIPRLYRQIIDSTATFEFAHALPEAEKLKEYSLAINCAGCMVTRNVMINRINVLKENGVPCVNYGLFLAWANGLLPRAIERFPREYEIYRQG